MSFMHSWGQRYICLSQAEIEASGASALNRLANLWEQSAEKADSRTILATACGALVDKFALISPRERLLDALSALHEGTACCRALWLAVAVQCATQVVQAADTDRARRRATAACDSLARAASLLGSPPQLLTAQRAPHSISPKGVSVAAATELNPWAGVVLNAASQLYAASQASELPLGQLAACLAAEDAAHVCGQSAALQACTTAAAGRTAVQDSRDMLHAWNTAQETGDEEDGVLAFPAAAALALWRWQLHPSAHGRGVAHGVSTLQTALPAMGAWVHSHPTQHTGVVVRRIVESVACALGGVAAKGGQFGAASSWPQYTQGPWLTLSTPVEVSATVISQHSREPAAAVLRLLLTHMSLGGDAECRQMAWGGVRELLARHTPVARLWLMRVALQALPQSDVAALLWDGVRHFCVGEARQRLPGGQGGFMSPALKPLVLDMQERRSAAAWPETDVGLVARAPVHAAFMSTLRLLCLRAAHLRSGGAQWKDADPSGVARYCACSKTFDTSYVQFLRSETAAALEEQGIGAGVGVSAAAQGGLQDAQQLPALALGSELPNAAVDSSSKQDVGLLLQLEGAVVQLSEELGKVHKAVASSPAAEREAWSKRDMGPSATQRPSAALAW